MQQLKHRLDVSVLRVDIAGMIIAHCCCLNTQGVNTVRMCRLIAALTCTEHKRTLILNPADYIYNIKHCIEDIMGE